MIFVSYPVEYWLFIMFQYQNIPPSQKVLDSGCIFQLISEKSHCRRIFCYICVHHGKSQNFMLYGAFRVGSDGCGRQLSRHAPAAVGCRSGLHYGRQRPCAHGGHAPVSFGGAVADGGRRCAGGRGELLRAALPDLSCLRMPEKVAACAAMDGGLENYAY